MMIATPIGQEQFVCCQPPGLGSELGLDLFAQAKAYVDQKYAEVVADIRAKVKAEVLAQIPTIRAEVTKEVMGNVPAIRSAVRDEAQSAVKPWVIGAIAVGALGVLGAGIALYRIKRRRRK